MTTARDPNEPGTAPGIVTIAAGVPRPSKVGDVMTGAKIVLSVCAGTAVLFALGELAAGRPLVAGANGVAAGLQGALLLGLVRPKRAEPFARIGLFIAVVNVTFGASQTGGLRSPTVWFLAGMPLLAGALLRRRSVVAFTLLSCAALALLLFVERGSARGAGPDAIEWMLKEMFFVLSAMVTGLAVQRFAGAQIHSLEQREETIQSLLRGLAEKNRELSAARDAALQASRAKGEFLATMSHEIRTPLNAVIGLTGVLIDTPLDEEQRELTGTIRSSGSSLLSLLNDLLDFSKIEAGRLDLESVPFDPADCAEDALDLASASAAQKKIDLACKIAKDVPATVAGDPGRVRQILVNLVSNAVKFTPRGHVEIELGVESTGPGDAVVLHAVVRDTGVGIPADQQAAIFDPFKQVDPSVTRRFGGTGLGLTICRKLAERMGGRIWVESAVGEGSAFHVTFEATLVKASLRSGPVVLRPGERRSASSTLPEPPARPARQLRVLIAEDNPVNQRVAQMLVERAGHRADVVGSGAEVIAEVRRGGHDVVLMDVQMPDIDGITAARSIRAEVPAERQPYILAITANASASTRDECLRAGMDAFLPKPIVEADLRRALAIPAADRGAPVRVEAGETPPAAPVRARETSGAAEPPAAAASMLDAERVDMLRGIGDAAFFASTIREYCDQSRKLLGAILDAAAAGDVEALARASHQLKGSGGMVGARAVMEQAAAIQRLGDAGDLAAAKSLVAGLQAGVEGSNAELLALVRQQDEKPR